MRLALVLFFFIVLPLAGFAQTALIDSLEKVIALNRHDDEEVKAYGELAKEYLRSNQERAKSISFIGIPLAQKLQLRTSVSAFYSMLITVHQNMGNLDSALFYLNRLQQLAAQSNGEDALKINYNYHASSGLYYKKLGNYKASVRYMAEAAGIAEKMNNTMNAAGQYINIGNAYMNGGQYKNALHFHLKALKLFEKINYKRGLSFCYQNIGNDFVELKQWNKGLEFINQALKMKKEENDTRGIATAITSLGKIYFGLKQYTRSLRHFNEALAMAQELKMTAEEAKIHLHIGNIYLAQKKTANAMPWFEEGHQLAVQSGDSSLILKAGREISAFRKNKLTEEKAETELLSQLAAVKYRGDKIEETAIYKNLSDFYATQQQYDKALQFSTQYYGSKDSLSNTNLQLEIQRLVAEYQAEKKEAEIALLKKDQQITHAELRRQKDLQYGLMAVFGLLLTVALLLVNRYKIINKTRRLVEMEQVRNRIAKDLHDDIGSTLTSISISSNLIIQQAAKGLTDVAGLQKIKHNSLAIMESMSDIIWAINPQNDTVEKLIFRMKEFASELLDPLNIKYKFIEKGEFASLQLDAQKKRDIYMVFKESINNAAKYSLCKNVQVILQLTGQTLNMEIKDDGKGFDINKVKKGNGLRNMDERIQSMYGSLVYQTAEGSGTLIKIAVPVT